MEIRDRNLVTQQIKRTVQILKPFTMFIILLIIAPFYTSCIMQEPMQEPVQYYQTRGAVFYDAIEHLEGQQGEKVEERDRTGGKGYIAVPDITVELWKPGKPQAEMDEVVAIATTDLYGYYRLPEVIEGEYKLCWHGPGWISDCFPDVINVQNHTHYAEFIFLEPELSEGGPVTGDVQFEGDGRCPLAEILQNYELVPHVKLMQEGAEIRETRVNANGEFVIPVSPESSEAPAFVQAVCPDVDDPDIMALTNDFLASNRSQRIANDDLIEIGKFSDTKIQPIEVDDSGFNRLTLKGINLKAERLAFEQLEALDLSPAPNVVQLQIPEPSLDISDQIWQTSEGQLILDQESPNWIFPEENRQTILNQFTRDQFGEWTKTTLEVFKRETIDEADDEQLFFSGQILTRDESYLDRDEIQVSVNRKSMAIQADRLFYGYIEPDNHKRYVLNIEADGYVPISRIYSRRSSGGIFPMEAAQTINFDASQDSTLKFTIPYTEQNGSTANELTAQIEIGGGTLKNPTGIYTGTVTAMGALLDPSQMTLPGDYQAWRGPRKQHLLISYGGLYITLQDNEHNPLEIAAGKSAVITVPILAHRNPVSAPITMPVWHYDASAGYWKELSTATKSENAYRADVNQLNLLSLGVDYSNNTGCIEVDVDSNTIPRERVLKAVISNSDVFGGGEQVREISLERKNISINGLPLGQTLTFHLLQPSGSEFSNFALKRDGETIPNKVEIKAGSTNCQEPIKLVREIKRHPVYYFLTQDPSYRRRPMTTKPETEAYYALMDPNGHRKNLGGWLEINHFRPITIANGGFQIPDDNVTSVAYLNHNNLGFGRKMHCRQDSERVACFVSNYATNDDTDNRFKQDPASAILAHKLAAGTGIATVAMEYSHFEGKDEAEEEEIHRIYFNKYYRYNQAKENPTDATKVVKFYAYDDKGELLDEIRFDPTVTLRPPHVCMVCHGGKLPTLPLDIQELSTEQKAELLAKFKDGEHRSSFREFDLANLRNLQGGNSKYKIKLLNDFVLETNPSPEIRTIINHWYGQSCRKTEGRDNYEQCEYIPDGWKQKEDLYRNVVARTCRSCHIARKPLDVESENSNGWQLWTFCNNNIMPRSFLTYNTFWMEEMQKQVSHAYDVDC